MENSQSSIDNRLSSIPGVCTCKTIDERKIRIKRRVERAEMSDGSVYLKNVTDARCGSY